MDEGQLSLLEKTRLDRNWLKLNHPLRTLFWECTLRCNLACRHCGSSCLPVARQRDMPLEDFLPVLDEIACHINPKRVMVFTVGGEPLVRPDLIDCGKAITKRGFSWGFVTNGMLLDYAMLKKLIDAKLRSIAVSIDGLEDDHNWMRGHHQSFKRAVRAVKLLMMTRNVCWDVITCVNKRNLPRLTQLRDFFISIGLKRWRIFTVFPAGRAKGNDDMQLSPEEYRWLMEFIIQTKQDGHINVNYCCEGFLGDYEGRVRNHAFRCDAGLMTASILADGSISGCLSIRSKYDQGNIYRDNFWNVWENRFEVYRNREWMHTGKCQDCHFWAYCEGNGMHLRDDNGELLLCNLLRLENNE